MMWVLMCFIALAVGFILYGKIQDKLPTQLQMPKSGGSGALVVAGEPDPMLAAQNASTARITASSMWQMRSDGANVELVRDFDGYIETAEQRYDAPTLMLTCYEGKPYARVDLHMAPQLQKNSAKVGTPWGSQVWAAGSSNDLYSPNPKSILDAVKAQKPFTLTLPYAELGPRAVTFTPKDGKKVLAAVPASCQ